ncbi:hypothetical protein PtA15_5A590 [Puccinia triticina]|uniref:SWIM-type domain-containing protein n=1 Tax=Puccinia triticina TaxID=208348 RepID=A0ABY7CQJ0_9BASI|nr:uncharacterized protein PtA15_5A590 [Puccinia triticina]WAQ85017.1 hypothetical protein PtA15_5A590 [Puccinia triticina]
MYKAQFVVSSFSAPGSQFYHVNFKPAVGLSKAQLLNCTCDHFTRVGSGCLHMYYLAREYRMLVVEEAPSNQHPIDPIYVESDTDVEVVSNGRPRPKRRNSLVFSPRESIVSKRGCFDAPSIPAFSTSHPNLCPPQIEMPTAGTSNGAYSINVLSHSSSPNVSPAIAKKPHFSGNVGKALNSLMMILKQAIEGMKTKKARQAMADVTPPATMNHFQLICNTLLRLVEERSQGHPHTLPPVFLGMGDTLRLSNAELWVIISEMQGVALAALKKTLGLLKVDKHSKAFVANSNELSVASFKERCYEVVGLLEEAKVLAARVQVR